MALPHPLKFTETLTVTKKRKPKINVFIKCIGGRQKVGRGQVDKRMVGIYEIRCNPYQILSVRAGRLGSQAKLYSP